MVLVLVTASSFNGGIRIDESIDDNVNYNVIMMEQSGGGNTYSRLMVDNGGLRFNPGTNYLYAQNFSGAFIGNGSQLTNLDASELSGALPAIMVPHLQESVLVQEQVLRMKGIQ